MGVPQGTILGPLLFILYINDLFTSMPEGEIISFANDTAVISNGSNRPEVEQKVDLQLRNIFRWLVLNELSVNIEKTIFITFGSYVNSVPENFSVQINNKQINRVDSCKYLGVHFDYRLTWESHIEKIINKTKYLVLVF